MKSLNQVCQAAILAAGLFAAHDLWAGDAFTGTDNLSSGNTIEDPPIPGLARTLTINTPVTQITDIGITLDISSADGDTAWNGDLYAQLTSPAGTLSVLLNRSGTSGSNVGGYGDAGFNITLNDSASGDIHTYQEVSYSLNGSGQLTGTWASDGRSDATSATRDKPLSQFFGENPNGTWTLFISDQASGNRAKLNSWSITGAGIAVPEPQHIALLATAALGGFALFRRIRN